MMVENINYPVFQTVALSFLLLFFLSISLRQKKHTEIFPASVTTELKGVAILMVLFAHIGYFLFWDHRFMFPLSVFGGIGVDLFLILSGYGLAVSASRKNLGVWQFYKRRLSKILMPFWLTLIVILLADKFVLGHSQSIVQIAQNFFGFFPSADIYNDPDSPLWFITIIIFYYLIFPWLFFKKWPTLSAIMIFVVSWGVLQLSLPIKEDVLMTYNLHAVAFPLGVLFFALVNKINWLSACSKNIYKKIAEILLPIMKKIPQRIILSCQKYFSELNQTWYGTIIVGLLAFIIYFAIYSGVGKGIFLGESLSLLVAVPVIILFLIKRNEFGFLTLLGSYAFEIYLIHWPIMYYYDVFYKWLPASVATIAYIFLFLILSKLLKFVSDTLGKLIFGKTS